MPKSSKGFKFTITELFFLVLVVISSVMLTFSSGSFVLNFKKIGFTVFSSAEKGVFVVIDGVKDTVNSVSELRKLKKDYNELVSKLQNYEQLQRSNADIRKENERLKELLDFSNGTEEFNIAAQIISRDLDDSCAYLTLDKGSINGIKKNMPVLAYQNGNRGLVGKIVQVGVFTSQVMPIYNINNNVSARIQNTRDLGLVSGLGNPDSSLQMRYIRKRVAPDLSFGDIIVTSGENDNYMRDIQIGTISKITVLDYNSSLNIEITPIIDFSRLENVIVVNPKELNTKHTTE